MAKKINFATELSPLSDEPEHIRHSLPLLKLLIQQLRSALCDNDHSIAQLLEGHNAITNLVEPIINKQRGSGELKQQMHKEISRMVVAFQGHDAFNQRLEHVISGLEAIEQQLADRERRDLGSDWEQLELQFSARYTTTQERHIHERMHKQLDDKEWGNTHTQPDPEGGSIEFF